MKKIVPVELRKFILNETISRQNKLWIIVSWIHFDNFNIEWKWAGEEMRSRLLLKFEGGWQEAKSYDEDIKPYLKFGKD